MTYKEKITDFVDILNLFSKDASLFPETNGGGLFLLDFIETNNRLSISLIFKDKAGRHCVINKSMQIDDKAIDDNLKSSFYGQAYYELMRFALFGVDSIGQIKDVNDNPINLITFSTLIGKGLRVLNKAV